MQSDPGSGEGQKAGVQGGTVAPSSSSAATGIEIR
ncbi:colicin release lysis protein [Escherichia coli]